MLILHRNCTAPARRQRRESRRADDVRVRGPRLLNVINGACVIRNRLGV